MRIEDRLVQDLMTRHPALLSPEDDLSRAVDVMRVARIRHLLVVDDANRLVGVLSSKDVTSGALFRASGVERATEARILSRIAVGEVMSKRVHTTTGKTTLSEAAAVMSRYKISCLPVISEGEIVGVLTERDFVFAFLEPLLPDLAQAEAEGTGSVSADHGWTEFETECERLRVIRDELRIQLQLASLDARDCFEKAERLWSQLERSIPDDQGSPPGTPPDPSRLGRNFLKETHSLYEEVRKHLNPA